MQQADNLTVSYTAEILAWLFLYRRYVNKYRTIMFILLFILSIVGWLYLMYVLLQPEKF